MIGNERGDEQSENDKQSAEDERGTGDDVRNEFVVNLAAGDDGPVRE